MPATLEVQFKLYSMVGPTTLAYENHSHWVDMTGWKSATVNVLYADTGGVEPEFYVEHKGSMARVIVKPMDRGCVFVCLMLMGDADFPQDCPDTITVTCGDTSCPQP